MNVLKKDLFGRPGARSKQGRNDLTTMTTLNTARFAKNVLPFIPQAESTASGSRPTTTTSSTSHSKSDPFVRPPPVSTSRHGSDTSEISSIHGAPSNFEVGQIVGQHQRRIEGELFKKPDQSKYGYARNSEFNKRPPSSVLQNASGATTESDVLRVLNDPSPAFNFLKNVDNLSYRAPSDQDKEGPLDVATEPVTSAHSRGSQITTIPNKTTASSTSGNKTPKSHSLGTNKATTSSTGGRTDAELSCCVVAVTEGRGHASGEVGIAAMDPRRPHLILCQISDSQRYTRTLTKLNIFNFIEAIVPNTFVDGPTPRKLYMDILDRFPSITVNHVQRRHFSEATGLQMIQQYCSQQSESVMVVLKDKFYALAAAAALLKYIEFTQSVLFAPYSLKIDYQGTEGTTIIDLDTANRLELVMGLGSRDERQSLLGVLKHCRTKGGVRLLRANLLQPFSDQNRINARLDCVQELIDNPILFNALEVVISQMKSAESLLSLCMHPPQQTGLKAAQYQLKYALLLKSTLELVPALASALEQATSDFFQTVRENLTDRRLSEVLKRIHLTIVEGTPGFRPGTFNQLHACFMICAGINGLLDIAKKTYCELAQEISDLVDGLKEKLQLPMRLGFSQGKGYHIVLSPLDQVPVDNLPPELILTHKSRASIMCYTTELVALDQRCQQALHEIELMSNVLLFELLNDIRDKIACLFPLCECIAELDVCVALAHIGAADGYVRPTFGDELHLNAARHPILDVTFKERIVANDVFADTDNNFIILTGPNQSGKSIYIRQIALLQVMAQVGSFVPASGAKFRIADRIFSRIGFDDNIESNSSTLMVELQDMKFIMGNLSSNSLIIVDELCRGTSVDEGTCLAFVLCEQLIDTKAFTFFTTHFLFLTKLQEMYYNVRNFHFETMPAGDGKPTLRYTHKMLRGITPAEQYGIQLAQLMGFSDSILESAKICARNLLRDRKPQPEVHGLAARYEISQRMRVNLPQSDEATWEQMLPVIRHYKEQYGMLPPENFEMQKLLDENPTRVSEADEVSSHSSTPLASSQALLSPSERSEVHTSPRQVPLSKNAIPSADDHEITEIEEEISQNKTEAQSAKGSQSDENENEHSLDESALISSIVEGLQAEEIAEVQSVSCVAEGHTQYLPIGQAADQNVASSPHSSPGTAITSQGTNEMMACVAEDHTQEPLIGQTQTADQNVALSLHSSQSTAIPSQATNEIMTDKGDSQGTHEAALLLLDLHAAVAQTPSKRKWTPPFKQECKNEKSAKKQKSVKEKPRIDEFVRNLGSSLPPIVDKSPYYQWKFGKDKKALKTVATACRHSPNVSRENSQPPAAEFEHSVLQELKAGTVAKGSQHSQCEDQEEQDTNSVPQQNNGQSAGFER